jgi:hypothetical protein
VTSPRQLSDHDGSNHSLRLTYSTTCWFPPLPSLLSILLRHLTMPKKGGQVFKRLKSVFRSGSSPTSSQSAAPATAQSQHSISTTTAVGVSEATEPLEIGGAHPFTISEHHFKLPLIQLLGSIGKSRMTSCRSSTNGIAVILNIQLRVS